MISALKELDGEFDLVFIDADKINIKDYCDLALERLSRHGIIAVDNALMDGKVFADQTSKASPESTNDSVRAMTSFNDYIANRSDLHKVLINIRDGIYLITKQQ